MTSAKCLACEKDVAVQEKLDFDCPHCGEKSAVVYDDDHQPTEEQREYTLLWYQGYSKRMKLPKENNQPRGKNMKDLREYILSLRTKRVWWKPWTWIRRSPLVAYWPLTEEGVAHAVNVEAEYQARFPAPVPPDDWDGRKWLVTGHTKPGYLEWSRVIYVNYVTPEELANLGFHGDPESIVIRPVN